MFDYFALVLTHALIAWAMLRLLARPDLDRDPDPATSDSPPQAAPPSAPVRPVMRRA